MHFRDFTPDDYQPLTELYSEMYPDTPGNVDDWQRYDKNRPANCRNHRWTIEHEGQIIGLGEYDQSPWAYHPQEFFVNVRIHPDFQGRGFGATMYDEILAALVSFDPIQLETQTRENEPHSMRWLEKRGWKLHIKEQRSALDLAEFDAAPWAGLEAKLTAEGIELKSIRELATSDPDWERKVHELDMATVVDVPGFDNFTPLTFKQWKKDVLESPSLNPDTLLIAVHDGYYVASTGLWKNSATQDLFTGLTATRREYRRKGIALALKVRSLTWAKANGCPRVHTDNEENNPMLQINYMLGFKDTPARMIYRKTDFDAIATDRVPAAELALSPTESAQ